MERRKLTKADLDKVRSIEGFPKAKDEDIIALSDAPEYTASPNPFIEEFLLENGVRYNEKREERLMACLESLTRDVGSIKDDIEDLKERVGV